VTKPKAKPVSVDEHDTLVSDKQVLSEFGNISSMALYRWSRDPSLNFPPKIVIRKRNFRSRRLLEQFKARMVERALKQRAHHE
jgi:hypothetical protein